MASWSEFAAAEPRLAASIHALVHQYGPGLGYLATVRADGGPRVHPVAPFITREGLYCFVIDSPKRRDLDRDGRYALHAYPPDASDDEAYLSGRANAVNDEDRVRQFAEQMRAAPHVDVRLYEFSVDVAMVVRHGQAYGIAGHVGGATHHIWRDPSVPSRRGRHRRRRDSDDNQMR